MKLDRVSNRHTNVRIYDLMKGNLSKFSRARELQEPARLFCIQRSGLNGLISTASTVCNKCTRKLLGNFEVIL